MPLFRRRKTTPPPPRPEQRALTPAGFFTINGVQYPYSAGAGGAGPSPWTVNRPRLQGVEQQTSAGHAHPVISAAVMRRAMVLSQFWPQWVDTATGNAFRSSGLAMFEDAGFPRLLRRAENHVAYAGNAYFHRRAGGEVRLLNPEHVQIVLESPTAPPETGEVPIDHAIDADVVGYVHAPPKRAPDFIAAEHVAHWAPEAHPVTPWLGSSWVSAIVQELSQDLMAAESSQKFFEQGSTPRLVFLMPNATPEQAAQTKEKIEGDTAGLENHWRNHYLGGGSDVKVIGASLKDMALKEFRGQLHTLVAMRSGVPAQLLGISEGMQGSALVQSSYGPARRQWADTFVSPYFDGLAAALEPLAEPPRTGRARLGWDPHRVLLMQEDRTDEATILSTKMSGIRQAVDGGFDADSAVAAFASDDLTLLEHTGLPSVQLQQPATITNGDNTDDDA